jgi:hypothetical protein
MHSRDIMELACVPMDGLMDKEIFGTHTHTHTHTHTMEFYSVLTRMKFAGKCIELIIIM